MRTTLIAGSLLSVALTSVQAATGQLGNAAVIAENPIGPIYKATLLDKDDTEVRGSIIATTTNKGKGVVFDVEFSGFPDEEENGPFSYHIHVAPVPESGNCTETLAHLDPFIRGEDPVCDATAPETCQVGDLSGKHGKITGVEDGATFAAVYTDLYASTQEGIGAFFGNRSIVVHDKEKNRLNCGNFELISGEGDDGEGDDGEGDDGEGDGGDSSSSSCASAYPTPSSSYSLPPASYPYPTPTGSIIPTGGYPVPTTPSSISPPIATYTGLASPATTFSTGAILAAVAAMFW